MGQPGHPLPGLLPCRVGEQVELNVARALEHGDLGDSPLGEPARTIAPAGESYHAALGELEDRGNVAGVPGDRAAVLELLRVVEGHARSLRRGADADAQVVGVGAPALPQPRQRPGGDLGQLGGIGRVAQQLGTFEKQRGCGIRLDRALVVAVLGQLRAARLLAGALGEEVVAHQQEGRQCGDDQEVEIVQQDRRPGSHAERQQRREDRQRPRRLVGRRRRQPQRGARLGGQDARRTVVVDSPAPGRGHEGGQVVVGHGQLDQAAGQGELRAERPRRRPVDRGAVEGCSRALARRPHGHLVGTRHLDHELDRGGAEAVVDAQGCLGR